MATFNRSIPELAKKLTLVAGAVAALLHGGASVAGSSPETASAAGELASSQQNAASKVLRKDYNLDLLPQQPSDSVYQKTVSEPDALYLKLTFDRASLPEGGYVEISNGASDDIATYRAADLLSMPITMRGDTAVIRIVLPSLHSTGVLHLAHVDYEKAAAKKQLRSLIGADDRRQRACYVGTDMYRYSLPAVISFRSGSGSVVGNGKYLLTNQHVKKGTAGQDVGGEIDFNYFRNSCDTTSKPNDLLSIRAQRLVAVGNGSDTDYSLVRLNDFDVQHAHTKELFGSLRIRPQGDNTVGDEIYIPQYGNGGFMPQVIGDLFEGKPATVTALNAAITYNADTEGGSSGSPVISRATNELVALHYAGGGQNFGVRLTTLHKYVLPYFENENDSIVGEGNVRPVTLTLPPFALGKTAGAIAAGATVMPFPDVKITHHGTYSEAMLDSQNRLTEDIGSARAQLYYQGAAGVHDLSSPAAAGDELFVRVVPAATAPASQGISQAWLPLKVTDAQGTLLENRVVRLQTPQYDPFTAPFDANSPDVIQLSLDVADAKKDSAVEKRIEGEQYAYAALYAGEGPSQYVSSTPEPYGAIQLPLKSQSGKTVVVRLRGYRATACSRRSMESTIGCSGADYSTLRLEYVAADNPDLPAGTYDGVLPLQAQKSASPRNILVSVHLKAVSDTLPVANAGTDRTVVATSDFAYAYPLVGSASSDPDGQALTYQWRAVSGPLMLRNGDRADAEVLVPKDTTGTGVFELTVTNDAGKTAKASAKVTVIAPTVTLGGSAAVNGSEAASYSASANFDQAAYTWALANASGQQAASGSGANWTLPADVTSGSYTLTVRANSTKGLRSATATQAVKVQREVAQPPVANAGADRTVVATSDFAYGYALVGSASRDPAGQALTYQWRVVSGPFTVRNAASASAEAIVPKDTTGTGVFELTVTNAAGKIATASTKVTAIAPAVTLTGSTSVAGDAAANYKAKANFDQPSYAWTLADASGQQAASGSGEDWDLPASVKSGSYTLTVRAESTKGSRSASAKQAVTVERAAEAKPLEAKISGPIEIEAGKEIQLSATQSVNPNGTPTTYFWTVPMAVGSNADTASVKLKAPSDAKAGAQYTIKLSVYDAQHKLSNTASYTVTVKASASPTPGPDSYPAYQAGASYKAGDFVLNNGQVYQCKPFPYGGWCSQSPSAYAPGKGWAWTDAWIKK
jgi:V8-like Glu-specific endopeptidase